jgi:hypothetical protein
VRIVSRIGVRGGFSRTLAGRADDGSLRLGNGPQRQRSRDQDSEGGS